jgi:hypothetical protein
MSAHAISGPNQASGVSALLLVLGLAVANSLLFYFVIWDLLSNWEPFSVLLFIVSGSAQLTYVFLPWFVREMLAPAVEFPAGSSHRYRDPNTAPSAPAGVCFASVATKFGVVLCAVALGLWLLQANWPKTVEERPLYISEGNCASVGGSIKQVDGKVLCVLNDANEVSDLKRMPANDG